MMDFAMGEGVEKVLQELLSGNLALSVVALTQEITPDGLAMVSQISSRVQRYRNLMHEDVVLPASLAEVDTVRKILIGGGDQIFCNLMTKSSKLVWLAFDKQGEELLEQLRPELKQLGLLGNRMVIFRKIDAVQAYCERRNWTSLPYSENANTIYLNEAVTLLRNCLSTI